MTDTNLKDPVHPSGPVQTKNWKIWVDRQACIGAATCVAVAAKTFQLDSEAKAIILDSVDEELEQTILDAAKACPVSAVIIEDEKGNRVFPK